MGRKCWNCRDVRRGRTRGSRRDGKIIGPGSCCFDRPRIAFARTSAEHGGEEDDHAECCYKTGQIVRTHILILAQARGRINDFVIEFLAADFRPPSSVLCPLSSDLRPLFSVLCLLSSVLRPPSSALCLLSPPSRLRPRTCQLRSSRCFSSRPRPGPVLPADGAELGVR